MGDPVVHFEIVGKDAAKLQSYYAELFGWQIDASNPMGYGIVPREGNTNAEGVGIGGGVGTGPEGYEGHVTFYVEVPDVEAALATAESLGGTRMMGRTSPWKGSSSASSPTPKATWSGSSPAEPAGRYSPITRIWLPDGSRKPASIPYGCCVGSCENSTPRFFSSS
jgi:uncharacterized protein